MMTTLKIGSWKRRTKQTERGNLSSAEALGAPRGPRPCLLGPHQRPSVLSLCAAPAPPGSQLFPTATARRGVPRGPWGRRGSHGREDGRCGGKGGGEQSGARARTPRGARSPWGRAARRPHRDVLFTGPALSQPPWKPQARLLCAGPRRDALGPCLAKPPS